MFTFATAGRIVFGRGSASSVGRELAAVLARAPGNVEPRVMLVTGANPGRHAPVSAALAEAATIERTVAVSGEPTTQDVRDAVEGARDRAVNAVVALGGGSAIDAGKAIAALVTNEGDPLDYLEVIGRGLPLRRPSLPFVALPTTAGTGAEVTKNAVLADTEQRVKVSLRADSMLPDVAIVDPELTCSVPPDVSAATGLDALTQVLEPFVSCMANPLTDALCREGLRRGARSLRAVVRDGADVDAREDLALTSLFGGLALANAKLGAVHGFAGPIGGMYTAPHGHVCARLLPRVMQTNVAALRQRHPEHPALARYDELGALLTGERGAAAEQAVEWVARVCDELQVPPLSRYGLTSADVPVVCAKAARASSMKGNPLTLTDAELRATLERAL